MDQIIIHSNRPFTLDKDFGDKLYKAIINYCTKSSRGIKNTNERNFVIQREFSEITNSLYRGHVNPYYNAELLKYFVSIIMTDERINQNINTDNIAEAVIISNYTHDDGIKTYLKLKWGAEVERGR